MTTGGDKTVFEPENCKSLDKKNKRPSRNKRINRLLKKKKVTTAAATVEPKCKLLGDPLIGASCSGTIRTRFKSLINGGRNPQTQKSIDLTKEELESIGNIVLSPPQTKLRAGDIQFCKAGDSTKPDDPKGYSRKLGDRDCHAEVSILSSLSRSDCLQKDTKILLNINWSNNSLQQKMPCETCKEIMDKIVADCGVIIEICNESGNPVPVKSNENYTEFGKKIMDKTEKAQDSTIK